MIVATLAASAIVLVDLAGPAAAQPADDEGGGGGGIGINPLCIVSPLLCASDEAIDLAGDIGGAVIDGISEEIGQLAGGAFQTIAAFFGQGAVSILEVLSTWWIENPSLITSRGSTVETIASYFYGLSALMVLAGFVWNGLQIMVQRRAEPVMDLVRATVLYTLTAASGVALVQGAARATDAWASDLVNDAFALDNLPEVFGSLLLTNTGLFLLFSIVLIVFGLLQALLLILREISLIILTGMIVFAASGQYFKFSRSWFGNLLGMIIPILLWKPIAAMLMAISLQWISTASGVGDIIIGLVLFAGSALAIKPLQKLFVVFTPGGGSSTGGGAAISAIGTGAMGAALLSNGGGAAASGAAAGGGGAAAGGAAAGGAAAGSAGGPAGMAAGAAVSVVAQTAQSQAPKNT